MQHSRRDTESCALATPRGVLAKRVNRRPFADGIMPELPFIRLRIIHEERKWLKRSYAPKL